MCKNMICAVSIMKIRRVWLTAVLFIGFIGIAPSHAQEFVNILDNGGFEDGVMEPWGTYGNVTTEVVEHLAGAAVPENPIEGNYCLHLMVPEAGANFWDTGLVHAGHVFEEGKYYTLSAFLKCNEGTLDINFKPEIAQDPWTGYGEEAFTMTEEWAEYSITTPVFTENVTLGEIVFHIQYAAGDFWIDCVRWYEGDYVPPNLREPGLASKPNPADGSIHEDTWATLSWKPGDFAVSHDVYFGESFDDVNDGTADTFRGNQTTTFFVVGFPGFPYPEGLVPGTTYYWRIDEVNPEHPVSPWKGDVWSFSIPPKTAYHPDPADGAESVAQNVTLSWTAGFGAKMHTVYFGDDYDTVANAVGGTAQGATTYTPGPLQLAKTYYWRVDEFDAAVTHKGDVWSFTTVGAAWNPNPPNGAVDLEPSQILTWSPGSVAASHDVYFGTDADAVKTATKASPEYKGPKALGDEIYDPSRLALETTYSWRIDEVNDTNPDSPWKGNVWSFTTGGFFVVDDFEHYTDDDTAGEAIWQSWIDGFGVPDNGAQVGYLLPPYAEQTIVHDGIQSMPVLYNNIDGIRNSEVALTLTAQRDWTEEQVAELSLWFHGLPGSVGSFTEGPVGTYTMTASGTDIWDQSDQFHFAYKKLDRAGSIVAKIESIQDTDGWAKAGVMIRETLDAGSKHAFACITPSNGVAAQSRPDTGDTSLSTNQNGITTPHWVKLERNMSGNFTISHSADGIAWEPVFGALPQHIAMASTAYVGLAVTSHNANATCEAVFSNVTITGTVDGQWANQDIGITSNDAEPLYVAVSNSGGPPAVVVHDYPAAATVDAWIEWVIPLSAFADQGINLTNVDKIAMGLGSQADATAAGGSGTIYIDDIRLYRLRSAP